MSEPLPTIYHGPGASEEDTRVVNDALQEIIARLNKLPVERDIPLKVLCSILVNMCRAQDDPFGRTRPWRSAATSPRRKVKADKINSRPALG